MADIARTANTFPAGLMRIGDANYIVQPSRGPAASAAVASLTAFDTGSS
jgi:hypothetical protein